MALRAEAMAETARARSGPGSKSRVPTAGVPVEVVEGQQLRPGAVAAERARRDLGHRLAGAHHRLVRGGGEQRHDGQDGAAHWKTISRPARTVAAGVPTVRDWLAGRSSVASTAPRSSVTSVWPRPGTAAGLGDAEQRVLRHADHRARGEAQLRRGAAARSELVVVVEHRACRYRQPVVPGGPLDRHRALHLSQGGPHWQWRRGRRRRAGIPATGRRAQERQADRHQEPEP